MKQILFGVSAVVVLGLYSCSSHRDHQYPQEQNDVSVKPFSNDVDIEADAGNAAFDVSALSEIVKASTDPKVLEEKINDPATNINNLDLDKDGKIDYLTITESGQNQLEIKDAAVQPEVMVARLTVTLIMTPKRPAFKYKAPQLIVVITTTIISRIYHSVPCCSWLTL
jgi:hypothetical protein